MKIRYLLYAAIFIGIAFAFTPETYLILKTDTDIQTIQSVKEDETFSIQWRHSVEKELWEESFKVRDDQIYIEETRFKTFGAGVPSHAGTDTYIEDGWVYMVGINREIGEELRVRTGKETEHRFSFQGTNSVMDHPDGAYTIRLERKPRIHTWYRLVMEKL